MKRLLVLMLLVVVLLGCADAESKLSGGSASTAIPDAAAIKKIMPSEQLALGDPIVNSLGIVLVPIPAGEFQMGSPNSESDRGNDETEHLLQITKPFYLSVYEVTQEQYERVMGNNPSHFQGANKPVDSVSWDNAVEFCRRLSDQEVVEYRLPTEAEWEYACRAGTITVYSFGDDLSQLPQYAWYDDNSKNTTHPIGQKLPNPWGLYDIHGNVWEWCQDWYERYGSEKVVIDPTGPAQGEYRVLRGGAFHYRPSYSRSAFRGMSLPDNAPPTLGFRLVRTYNLSP